MIDIERIEKIQDELFCRLEDDLAMAKEKDYYLSGKDIYQYTQSLKNLEDLKRRQ